MPQEEKQYDFKGASSYHKEWSTYVFDLIGRPLAVFITKYTSITPNQISVISFFFAVAGAYFLFLGGYQNILIGAILAFIYNVLDMIDGRIARAKRLSSLVGKWLDAMIDFMVFPLLIFALALGMKNYLAAIIGMLAILSYPNHYLLVHFYKSEIVGKKDPLHIPGKGKFEWLRYVYGSNFFYLFLLVAAILGKPLWVLLFWATFGNLYWMVVMVAQYFNIRKIEKNSEAVVQKT